MENKAWIAAAGRLAAYACAVYIAGTTAIFAWRGTLFVATADAWGFIATFLSRYYAGTLTLADFFAKRNGLDHSQPLQKLLFLAYARFFDLDFAFEALTGVAFGMAFIAVIVAIVCADTAGQPRAKPVAALTTLGATAIVLSLNDEGIFDWSLATLSLMYPLGIALMLVLAYRCLDRNEPWRLALVTFAACLVLDTSAILCATAIIVLIALRRGARAACAHRRRRRRGRAVRRRLRAGVFERDSGRCDRRALRPARRARGRSVEGLRRAPRRRRRLAAPDQGDARRRRVLDLARPRRS